jgi:hypothetical protein
MRLTAYLSGAENSLPDYPFPLIYLSINQRSGEVSYYSATTIFSAALLDAFAARPDGKVYILADGSAFDHFNLGNMTYYVGGRQSSVTLSGTRTQTNSTPAALSIFAGIEKETTTQDGRVVLTVSPFAYSIRAGDTAIYAGTDYLVTRVATQYNPVAPTRSITLEPQP